jgi:hypothetical protein
MFRIAGSQLTFSDVWQFADTCTNVRAITGQRNNTCYEFVDSKRTHDLDICLSVIQTECPEGMLDKLHCHLSSPPCPQRWTENGVYIRNSKRNDDEPFKSMRRGFLLHTG